MTGELTEIIKKQLPELIKTDEEIRQLIVDLASYRFADKKVAESRFDRILDEMRRDREEQSRKWEEQNKKWEENQKALNKKWEEQNKKWWENQKTINNLIERLEISEKKHESSIGALGARWGIFSEESFRNGLKAILEESFEVEVYHINDWDEDGYVFGRPDQVEIDIIIKNDKLIICELKSSISKSEMYHFERKISFYEKKHNCKADRKLIISPMVDKRAKKLAEQFGVEVYSHSYDVPITL